LESGVIGGRSPEKGRFQGEGREALPAILKPRQAAVLEFIRATIRHRGIGPSIQRIRDAGICGRENAQVYRVIGQLIRMRLICRGGPPLPHTNEPSLVVIEGVHQ